MGMFDIKIEWWPFGKSFLSKYTNLQCLTQTHPY